MNKPPQPEFHRAINLDDLEYLDDLDGGPLRRDIEADGREREVLARRLDLPSLDSLKASVELKRVSGGPLVRVEGRLWADVVQRCVVTLGPVPSRVEGSFSELYGPPGFVPDGGEEAEMPEPFDGGAIDAGELVVQHLSLALDPYPRAPGVNLAGPDRDEAGGERPSPFAALESIRKKR